MYFVTFTVIDWLDVFSRAEYSHIVVDSLNYCIGKKGLRVYSWCIMTNHIHLIIKADEGKKLSAIIRDFKRFTAIKIIDAISNNPCESRKEFLLFKFKRTGEWNVNNTKNQFWIQDNHPVELNSAFLQAQKLEYIHNNPVKAEIVALAEDYIFSSASTYADGRSLVKIEFIK